ncbi:MAG: hypothetical protein JW951_07675 [Lentisphaerae bacterium]|nr:hypothetical protein [Lentisphaerota bacterium]
MNVQSIPPAQRQRRHIAAIFALTAVLLIALAAGGLWPLLKRRDSARATLARVDEERAVFHARFCRPPLAVRIRREATLQRTLEAEWKSLRRDVDTFGDRSPLSEGLPKDEEGRIDFKVALFEARTRLQELAGEKGVTLPADLGIPEAIATDEHAETRLWQLATTVKLVEQAIAAHVQSIETIHSLPPVRRTLREQPPLILEEYPVRLVLQCSFPILNALTDALQEPGSFFTLRHILAERTQRDGAAPLTVDVVYGGMLFRENVREAE